MLRFYNVLEVGRLTEFIPEAFWPDEPDGLRWPQALLFLRMVVVGIQNHPPSLSARLPLLLARRLNDPDGLPQVVGSEPTSLMLEFLTLDKQFVRDHRCGELLYWLMGKTGLPYMSYSSRPPTPSAPQQTFSFESVVEAIAERPRFMASLFQPPQQRDWLGCALYELHQLLQFCFDLHRLLHRSAEYPLLQSEFWHHYGYWLGEHGQAIRSGLVKALTQFIQWVPETQDSEARTAVESYVKQARDVIEDLTSSKYEGAVSTLFSCPPEDETKHSGSK
jgi:hypothetical protein